MKKLLLLILLSISFNNIFAQNSKTEKIYPIPRALFERPYYIEQIGLYEKLLEKDPKNASAWLNYYTACRVLNYLDRAKTKNLTEIKKKMVESIPNTFEAEYVQFWNAGWDEDCKKHLRKAYELAPNRPETFRDMMGINIMEGNYEKAAFFASKLYESQDYSLELIKWAYNQLMSVEDNAILITNGDNDTYYPWMMQYHHKIKPEVTLINSSLIFLEDYRNRLFEEMGLPKFTKTIEELRDVNLFRLEIIKHMIKHSGRPMYFTLGGHFERDTVLKENLYLVGLTYQYCEHEIDEMAILRKNYEQKFILDHIQHSYAYDVGHKVNAQMNQIYLPAFIQLYKHYTESGETQKAEKVAAQIRAIGKAVGNEEEIEEYLKVNN
jgi:hypothetical protein